MKLKLTDNQRINRRRCEEKGCPNKATAIFKTKYLCEECNKRVNPKPNDRKFKYINSIYAIYEKNLVTSP